ncbi:MAG: leucine-rich repeat domain-containing protein [Bacteroidaceae bacterium]|nr:leucine-rich repeat domain-containing protein [Bacteroidaceae bacterium]
MKKVFLASVLLLQAIISSVHAQQSGDTIKGIVKREFAPGYRMAFVPIFERDSTNHIVSISTTDSEGRFSIQLQNPDDMIEVYCSGYQNNRFSIDSLFLELIMEPITITVNGITYCITDSTRNRLCVFKANRDQEEIVIPDTLHYNATDYLVTSVGDYAFSSSDAHSIILPQTISQIGQYAFSGCKNLESIIVPSGVTELGTSTFHSSGVSSVSLPSALKQIGSACFRDCQNLISVDVPQSVTEIGNGAFSNCTSLETVRLPDGPIEIGAEAFKNCTSLETVRLPDSLFEIPRRCFEDCVSLSDISLPKCLYFIDVNAFARCVSLKEICIPESIAGIDLTSLRNCSSLSTLSVSCERPDTLFVSLGYGEDRLTGTSITLKVPEGTFELYDSLWKNNVVWGQFARITDGVRTTQEKSFNDNGIIYRITDAEKQYVNVALNYAVGNVVIPMVVESPLTKKQYSVQGIDNQAFCGNGNLITVEISPGLTSIPDSCFFHCWQLTDVTLPNSIKNFGQESFGWCNALKTINIPEGVTVLPDGIFNCCRDLSTIELPRGLKTIGKEAFNSCHSLESIEIPASVDSIGTSAFNSCWTLKSVTIPRKVTVISNSMFTDCFELQKIRMKGKVSRIEDSAFENCYQLNDFVIPRSVEFIGNDVFNRGEPYGFMAWDTYQLYFAD